MAEEATVESLLIEVDADAKKAESGLMDMVSALQNLKDSVSDFNTDKLTSIKNALNSFSVSRESMAAVSEFSTMLSRLNSLSNTFTTKNASTEINAVGKYAREAAKEIGDLYGLSKSAQEEVANGVMSMARSFNANGANGHFDTIMDEVAKDAFRARHTVNDFAKEYEDIVYDMSHNRKNSVLLDFQPSELGDDWKQLHKIMGNAFTFDRSLMDGPQIGFDSWIRNFDTSQMNMINQMAERLGGMADDSASVFRALAAIKQEYSDYQREIRQGAVAEDGINKNSDAIYEILVQKLGEISNLPQLFGKIDFDKYVTNNDQIVNTIRRISSAIKESEVNSEAGDNLKNVGEGFNAIAKAILKLKGIDSEQLHDIVSTVNSIGTTLGNLGSNNNVSIKITDKGVMTAKENVEELARQIDSLKGKDAGRTGEDKVYQSDENLLGYTEQLEEMRRQQELASKATPFNPRQVEYAQSIKDKIAELTSEQAKYQATIQKMESGQKTNIAKEDYEAAVKGYQDVTREIEKYQKIYREATSKTGQDTESQRLQELIIKRKEYNALITGMQKGTIAFDKEKFTETSFALQEVNKELNTFMQSLNTMPQFTAADTISQKMQYVVEDLKRYKAIVADMQSGKIGFDAQVFDTARQKIKELTAEYAKFENQLAREHRATGLDGLSRIMQGIIDKQKEMQSQMGKMMSGEEGFNWKDYKANLVQMDKMQSFTNVANTFATLGTPGGLEKVAGVLRGMASEMNKVADAGQRVLRVAFIPIQMAIEEVRHKAKSFASVFQSAFANIKAGLKKLSAFWQRAMRTFTFMLVRKSITALIGEMKNAVDSLAQWSKDFGTPFNQSISDIIADFKYMARSILSIFEPLINALAPILNRIADMFSNLAGKIAQIMAALTGQNYWMKAKKNVTDYAASLDKSSKAAKNGLQSFDELNNITTQKKNGNDDAGGYKNEWEKMPVTKEAKDFADKIKKILSDLWYPIGKAWDAMKDYVLDGWKYMTGEMKLLLKDVWRDFIEVWHQEATVEMFKDIFGIVGDIEFTIGNLVKNFREAWNNGRVGKKIFENIRDIFATLVRHVRNVTKYMKEWSKSIDFNPMLKTFEKLTKKLNKVADFLGYIFEDVMKLGVLKFTKWFIETGLPHINNAISNVIDAFNFDKIRKDLQPVISSVEGFFERLETAGTTAFEHVGEYVAKWFNSDKFTRLANAIQRIFDVFTEERMEKVFEGIGMGFVKIAEGIADFVSSDLFLGFIDWLGSIVDFMGAEGIANFIKFIADVVFWGNALAPVLVGLAAAISFIAKVEFAANVAAIAASMGALNGAAAAAGGAGTIGFLGKLATGLKALPLVAGKFALLAADFVLFTEAGKSLGKAFAETMGNESDVALYESYAGVEGSIRLYMDTISAFLSGDWMPQARIVDSLHQRLKNEHLEDLKNEFENLPGAENIAIDPRATKGLGEEGDKFLEETYRNNLEWVSKINQERITLNLDPIPFKEFQQNILYDEEALANFNAEMDAAREKAKNLGTDLEAVKNTKFAENTDIVSAEVTTGQNAESISQTAEAMGDLAEQTDMSTEAMETYNDMMNTVTMSQEEFSKRIHADIDGNIADSFIPTGNEIASGVAEGMATYDMTSAINGWYEEIKGAIKTTFDIAPPAKKMNEDGENIVRGILEGFSLVDFPSEMQTWWDTNVAPWFATDKWSELAEGMKIGIKNKWVETVDTWNVDIAEWWSASVEPYFTTERWTSLLSGIAPAFKAAFKDAVNGSISAMNKLLGAMETTINESLHGLDAIANAASSVGAEVSLTVQDVKFPRIPAFAKGGFVPEDGLFYANHNELIGSFDNGRTAVANNEQITAGIANAVASAYAPQNELMRTMVGLMEEFVDKEFTVGDDAIYSSYQRGAARHAKRYGY